MKTRAIVILTVYALFVIAASWWMAQQSYSWFPPAAAAESKLIDNLFSIFTALGTMIFLGVLGPLIYSLIFHRAGRYDFSDGPPIEGSTTLEVIWTAVPILLVAGLVTASYQTYSKMAIRGPMELVHLHMPEMIQPAYADERLEPEVNLIEETASQPVEEIDVTARQWAWVFHYPHDDVTSTELHLPVDRRVRLVLRSEDVLHGFYVPAFRLKQDVVPNHTIDFEFTPIRIGTYRLRDSLYSGTYFAANQADVVVQSEDDYRQWLAAAAAQPPSPAYNQAAFEYARAGERAIVSGWKTVPPAPPPVVNYAPKQEPTSPPS
ncbi:MAG: cytochrome c oxidase subunit II [Synechococcales cyanobacterium C42_A2020_086]|jgi:cytochrome c oxidase subunit 2|nr:cytochrome c oxidase subunit II [Synechococcales cyanobacterium C42_A2020_086]